MAQRRVTPAAASASAAPTGAIGTTSVSVYIWVVLFASLLVQTAASFGNQAVSPLAPSLTSDLGLSRSQVGLIVTAFYGGAVLLLTAAGWVSDRLGVRRMFLIGLIVCGLPLVLGAQAEGLPFLAAPPGYVVGAYRGFVGQSLSLSGERWPGFRDAWTAYLVLGEGRWGRLPDLRRPIDSPLYRCLQAAAALAAVSALIRR